MTPEIILIVSVGHSATCKWVCILAFHFPLVPALGGSPRQIASKPSFSTLSLSPNAFSARLCIIRAKYPFEPIKATQSNGNSSLKHIMITGNDR